MDYTQITDEQRGEMLSAIGVASVDALFGSLPADAKLGRSLDLPAAMSELELQRELASMLGRNRTVDRDVCFMGCGAYDHFIPTLVGDVANRGEFLTAYTPYQAEASQGSLQAFFEFQTQVTRLTGLDVSNASLYEGASAVSEAVFMAINSTGKRRVVVASTLHPHYRAVLDTSCSDLPVHVIEVAADKATGRVSVDALKAQLDNDTACVVIQSPNVFGVVEDWTALFGATHEQDKTLAIAVFNPIACALLKNPGACGADIAAGEGQPLGIPLQYGGPWLGLFAAKQNLIRKMPGRLIGQTVDADGRRGFCLTLQTREQHIRGAKATSNVCTNQGLLALRATVYMSLLGPNGLREVARQCYHKAHHAAKLIGAIKGYTLAHGDSPFFHEFAVDCPVPAAKILETGRSRGIMPGVDLSKVGVGGANQLLVTVTEKRTAGEIDALVALLGDVAKEVAK
ncbi:MAG: aminomethyl-transferring glycine dehydrogenase subunit GcvPA [Phycisphaera sp.]|nr:aminomethyl-transferring glycine dehydrogenase subunit GcvPA [Phycisphaera sp.]